MMENFQRATIDRLPVSISRENYWNLPRNLPGQLLENLEAFISQKNRYRSRELETINDMLFVAQHLSLRGNCQGVHYHILVIRENFMSRYDIVLRIEFSVWMPTINL